MKIYHYCILLLLLATCSSREEIPKEKVKLIFKESVNFNLGDSLSFNSCSNIRFFSHADRNYLAILSYREPLLLLFDYNSQKLLREVYPRDLEAYNQILSLRMEHPDTFYLYNLFNDLSQNQYDMEGRLLEKKSLDPYVFAKQGVYPFADLLHPILQYDNELYFNSSILHWGKAFDPNTKKMDLTTFPSAFKFSAKLDSLDFLFPLTEHYNSMFWGMTEFKYYSHFIRKNNSTNFLVGYGIDPNIYEYTKNQSIINKKAIQSKYLPSINPFDNDPNTFGKMIIQRELPGQDTLLDYAYSNSEYQGLLYDPKNDIYIRIAYIRPPDHRMGKLPRMSLIFFNGSLEKLGEQLLPIDYHEFHRLFINEDGLYIFKSKNHENITFDLFEIDV